MEPMALGSAPSSPSSPGSNPNYLPSYLMGETQATTPNKPTASYSPELPRNFGYNLSETDSQLRQQIFNNSRNASILNKPEPPITSLLDTSVTKTGPPRLGLFDTLDKKNTSNLPDQFGGTDQSFHSDSFNASYRDKFSQNDFPCSSNVNESFSRSYEAHQSGTVPSLWVTVFGFSPSTTSLILSRFANCGTIVDKRFPTQGNWVHLKFNTFNEAANALALNGKLISNNMMIGVIYHQVRQSASNKENLDRSVVYTSPVRARSLRHSFVSPQHSNTVIPPQNVPQKSTGLVTKAMEYVFGW